MALKVDAKTTMLAHSEAKVDFYQQYLSRYLKILTLAPGIDTINIFDVYCGTGVYENGKKGSPLVAFDEIKKLKHALPSTKKITLTINDGKEVKVASVRQLLDAQNNPAICDIHSFNMQAEEMFQHIQQCITKQDSSHRNLIFIDPYGYKQIKKHTLESLMANTRSEIILFLPISQMQRFTVHALETDEVEYEPLRNFVDSFFPEGHPIRKAGVGALDYIDYLTKALQFGGKYFTTSFFIERNTSSRYSLFFMSSHVYGFEKILEVKWLLDDEQGRGFKQPTPPSLFENHFKEEAQVNSFSKLEDLLKNVLSTEQTNRDIYLFTLKNGFRPTHTVQIFDKWEKSNPRFEALEYETGKPARGFYLSFEHFSNAKPKVKFKLK